MLLFVRVIIILYATCITVFITALWICINENRICHIFKHVYYMEEVKGLVHWRCRSYYICVPLLQKKSIKWHLFTNASVENHNTVQHIRYIVWIWLSDRRFSIHFLTSRLIYMTFWYYINFYTNATFCCHLIISEK